MGKNLVMLRVGVAQVWCNPQVILMAYMPLGHDFSSHELILMKYLMNSNHLKKKEKHFNKIKTRNIYIEKYENYININSVIKNSINSLR